MAQSVMPIDAAAAMMCRTAMAASDSSGSYPPPGTVVQERFSVPGLVFELSGPDGPATLSFRPERIALTAGGTDRLVSATYLGSQMECGDRSSELLISRPIKEAAFAVGAPVSISIASTDVSRVA